MIAYKKIFSKNSLFDFVVYTLSFIFFIVFIMLIIGVFLQISPNAFINAFESKEVWYSIFLSFRISLIVIAINLLLGIPTAYILSFKHNKFSLILDVVSTLPLVTSALIIGFGVLITMGSLNPIGKFLIKNGIKFVFTTQGIILVQTIISFPFFVNIAKQSFDSVNRKMLYMAQTLGASSFDILFRIILPISYNGIIAAIAMSWARSMGEYAATQMVSGVIPNVTETAPIEIAFKTGYGDYNAAIAISSILVLVSIVSLIVFKYFSYKVEIYNGKQNTRN